MSCPDCFTGSVHTHDTPQGSMQELHGCRTYVTGLSGHSASKATIIYLPDAFSLKLINSRLLADRYAKETGYRVLLPDLVPGGGLSAAVLNYMDTLMKPAGWNPLRWFGKVYYLIRTLYHVLPFMIRARAPKAYSKLLTYARAVKAEIGPDAKLGVCGFCWGGYAAVNLCTEPATASDAAAVNLCTEPATASDAAAAAAAATGEGEGEDNKNLIDASFTAHPAFLKTPDMIVNAVTKRKVPFSIAVAESDFMVNAKAAEEVEAILREKVGNPTENNYEVVIYRGCNHGFAVRANPDVKIEFQGQEDALKQGVDWLKKYLEPRPAAAPVAIVDSAATAPSTTADYDRGGFGEFE